eukprot:6206143-Pleurochrysis_carterae.AAC.5
MKRGQHSRVGRDGRGRRPAHLAPRFWDRVHPPDRIGEPTARVPPPYAVTYAGEGPERVREGGRRGPPASAAPAQSRARGVRVNARGRWATPSGWRG